MGAPQLLKPGTRNPDEAPRSQGLQPGPCPCAPGRRPLGRSRDPALACVLAPRHPAGTCQQMRFGGAPSRSSCLHRTSGPPPPLLAGGTDVTSLVPPSRPPSCCRSGPSTRPFPTRRRRQSFAVRETWRGEPWSAAPRPPAVPDGRGVSPLPGVRRPHPQRRPDGGVGAARPPLPCWKLSRRVHLVYPVLSNFPFIPSLVIQKCASSFPNT